MRYVYPVKVVRDEGRAYVASCRDIPEALTEGNSIPEALGNMSDALGAALAGYALVGRSLPSPSHIRADEYAVPVAPLVAAKLALRGAMTEQGISNMALARRLGLSEGAVRRLVNPDHDSRLDGIVAALAVLGHGLVVEDMKQNQVANG